jgi:group I intron endonuclease
MVRGVYQIRNLRNGKIYIGSSDDLTARWRDHRKQLRSGKHPALRLKADVLEFGLGAFVFEILEEVRSGANLRDAEQRYLDLLKPCDPAIGYNSYPNARGAHGVTRSAETKQKMREARLKVEMTPEWNRHISEGRKRSAVAKAATEALNKAKRALSDDEVREVMRLHQQGVAAEAIGDRFGVSRRPIRAILSGETYSDVTGIGRASAQ